MGAFANGDFPFDGRIGAVTVFGSALTNNQVCALVCVYWMNGWMGVWSMHVDGCVVCDPFKTTIARDTYDTCDDS